MLNPSRKMCSFLLLLPSPSFLSSVIKKNVAKCVCFSVGGFHLVTVMTEKNNSNKLHYNNLKKELQ